MNRPYHHGTLRDALLDEAQLLLAEQGSAAVSLRELARRAGVSHSAPERHFANRQALLDAVAARGFTLLAEAIRLALADHGDRLEDRFRAAAEAYISFALENAALLELMFASKADRTDDAITTSAADLFSLTAELVGESREDTTSTAVSPLRLVVVATLQGIANLAAAHRIQPGQVDEVIDQAVAIFTPLLAPRERPPADN
ncbi:MAG TPA: TetR/AcrR family transcriptional regulator [Trebonia sp.]|jgi:AcrR family transcriptional regulator